MNISKMIQVALQYYQEGKLQEAEQIYRKILETSPSESNIYNNLGNILQTRGKIDEAIHCYNQAITFSPKFAGAHYNLGDALQEKGELDQAIMAYHKAIEIDPGFVWAYTNLGVALHRQGSFKEAEEYLQRAVKIKLARSNSFAAYEDKFLKKGNFQNYLNSYADTLGKKTLIAVPVFNRKKITQLSLAQMKKYKSPNYYLQVYNDHSTEYDNSFLIPYSDEVISLPEKMYIHNLRWYQFRYFLKTDFDFLYMTDNDVIHDPDYIRILEALYEFGNREHPVCLFNSVFHMNPDFILYWNNGIILRKTAPGISMFFDREMVTKIVSELNRRGGNPDSELWDFIAIEYLGLPWITPEISYLEHFGEEGMHNINFESDRAMNPTNYLIEKRKTIIDYLRQDIESPVELLKNL